MDTIEERFAKFFQKKGPDDYWNWNGSLNGDKEYGLFVYDHKRYLAHRLALQLSLGRELQKPMALHTCNNSICVNPNHLYEGTAKNNIDDCIRAGHLLTGENHKHAKLNWKIVRRIRATWKKRTPGRSAKDLAQKYGVFPNAIFNIIRNKSWKT